MMEKNYIHIINSKGEKKVVPFVGEELTLEDIPGNFMVDDEWYLSHGYVTLEQHKKHLDERIIEND